MEATPNPADVPTFRDLNMAQVRGQQCIVCRASFLGLDGAEVPESVVVGRAAATGGEVRACVDERRRCAHLVGYVPDAGHRQTTLL